jgi:hypothetical protein
MKLWPWLTLAIAVIITKMSKETDASKPSAPAPGKKVARGIRNNNPGNIRIGINWLGRVVPGKDVSFVEFKSMPLGVRALYIDLINKHKTGLNTIQKVIYKYAPPSENKTEAYIASVAQDMKIPATQVFAPTVKNFNAFAKSIVKHETYPDNLMVTANDYALGLAMARTRPDINEYIKNA